MSKPKPETPLDDSMVELWRKGGIEPTSLPALPAMQARHLRHRMYRERKKMQRLRHEAVEFANRASISLSAGEEMGTLIVTVYPINYHIQSALSSAGVTPIIEPPPLDDLDLP